MQTQKSLLKDIAEIFSRFPNLNVVMFAHFEDVQIKQEGKTFNHFVTIGSEYMEWDGDQTVTNFTSHFKSTFLYEMDSNLDGIGRLNSKLTEAESAAALEQLYDMSGVVKFLYGADHHVQIVRTDDLVKLDDFNGLNLNWKEIVEHLYGTE